MKTDDKVQEIILCECGSTEHQLIIRYDKDDVTSGFTDITEVYIDIHLATGGFWSRLKRGMKYIFGHKSRFGDWDEIIVGPQHADQLQAVVDFLKSNKK